jgi:hypothetical protein
MIDNLQSRSVTGAVAGNLAVPGIKKGDRIITVVCTSTSVPGANLASEFKATADDLINNTGGTSTAGVAAVLVQWEKGSGTGRTDTGRGKTGRSSS